MRILLSVLALMFTLGLTACDMNEGPAEEVGENIDNAMTDAGNAVEDLCEDAKEGMNAEDEDC